MEVEVVKSIEEIKEDTKVAVLYKEVGVSPGDMVKMIKILHPNKESAYAGRLDPMACGHMHFLFDEYRKMSPIYNKLDKTYQFQVLVGLNTDSTDILGKLYPLGSETLVHSTNDYICDDFVYDENNNSEKSINIIINKFLEYSDKEYEQEYHIYSSMTGKPVDGSKAKEPLWSITKNNKLQNYIVPTKKIKIYNNQLINVQKINWNDCQLDILNRLSKLNSGESFRKDEIVEQWQNYDVKNDIHILTFKAFVSSGTYIRQLVKDVGYAIQIPLCVLEIQRLAYD